MAQTLYYTLSTIAQTLAAALAVLVALALFRLTALAQAVENAKVALNQHGTHPRWWPLIRDRGFDAGRDEVNRRLARGPGKGIVREGWEQDVMSNSPRLRQPCEAGAAAFKTWGEVNAALYIALAFTVLTIALCLVGLARTTYLSQDKMVDYIIVTVGLAFVCLLLYVYIIFTLVRRPTEPDPPTD